MKKIFYYAIGVTLLSVAMPASAAVIKATPNSVAVGVGQNIRFDVVLDTENASVNAVSGFLILPDTLKFDKLEDGWSIIGIWVEKPDPSQGANRIRFSGIIPNGFSGVGVLFSVFAKGEEEGMTEAHVENGEVLANDGKGTVLAVSVPTSAFSVVKDLKVTLPTPVEDVIPPKSFTPLVAQSEDLFDGKYFVMFNTLDPGSGIEKYEIFESRREYSPEKVLKTSERKWKEVANPAPLDDQSLGSYIYIKAIDRAGNAQVAMLIPPKPENNTQVTYRSLMVLSIIVIVAAALYVWFFLRRRKYGDTQ